MIGVGWLLLLLGIGLILVSLITLAKSPTGKTGLVIASGAIGAVVALLAIIRLAD